MKDMGKKLYFVRHGETLWNAENKICGRTDIALTERGHEQAIEAGNTILSQKLRFDEILSSPLVRARETAGHISRITGVPVRIEPRLIEQNFGRFEATDRKGEEFLRCKEHFADRYGDGESLLQLAQRIYNLLDEIRKEDKVYLLVAHNAVARMVQSYFFDMTNQEYARFGIKNCQVVTYEYRTGMRKGEAE